MGYYIKHNENIDDNERKEQSSSNQNQTFVYRYHDKNPFIPFNGNMPTKKNIAVIIIIITALSLAFMASLAAILITLFANSENKNEIFDESENSLITTVNSTTSNNKPLENIVGNHTDKDFTNLSFNTSEKQYNALEVYNKVNPALLEVLIYENEVPKLNITGVIVTKNGYAIIPAYAIEYNRDKKIKVRFSKDDKLYDGFIVGFDRIFDICVIKIYDKTDLDFIEFESNDTLIGQNIFTLSFDSIDTGIINRDKTFADFKSINGPKFFGTNIDLDITKIGSIAINENAKAIGFCIYPKTSNSYSVILSAKSAKNMIESIIKQGFVENRVRLGILAKDYQKEDGKLGVLIETVNESSNLYKAGVRNGDIIYKIEDSTINNMRDLDDTLLDYKKDDICKFYIDRDNTLLDFSIKLEGDFGQLQG